jgi:hypothetical protein
VALLRPRRRPTDIELTIASQRVFRPFHNQSTVDQPARRPLGSPCNLAALLLYPLTPEVSVRRVLREQLGILHRRLLTIVRDDDVCRRLMTIRDRSTGLDNDTLHFDQVNCRAENRPAGGIDDVLFPAATLPLVKLDQAPPVI